MEAYWIKGWSRNSPREERTSAKVTSASVDEPSTG